MFMRSNARAFKMIQQRRQARVSAPLVQRLKSQQVKGRAVGNQNNVLAKQMVEQQRQARLNGTLSKRLKPTADRAKQTSEEMMSRLNNGKEVAGSEVASDKLVEQILKKPTGLAASLVSEKPTKPRTEKDSTGSIADKIKGKKTDKKKDKGNNPSREFEDGITESRKRPASTLYQQQPSLVDGLEDGIDPKTLRGVAQPSI